MAGQSYRRAFTLIELLVVISIITLLIAILLPALRSARTAAQGSVSLSNSRQIMLALYQYAADSKDNMPFCVNDVSHTSSSTWSLILGGFSGNRWNESARNLPQYISNPSIFWSPGRDTQWINNDIASVSWLYCGYSVNSYGALPGESSAATPYYYRFNLGHKRNPPLSRLLVMAEGFRNSYFTDRKDGDDQMNRSADSIFTYNGGAVRSYMDGHASSRPGDDFGWYATSQRGGEWGDGIGSGDYWVSNRYRSEPYYAMRYPNNW